jgi:hypothetical protein
MKLTTVYIHIKIYIQSYNVTQLNYPKWDRNDKFSMIFYGLLCAPRGFCEHRSAAGGCQYLAVKMAKLSLPSGRLREPNCRLLCHFVTQNWKLIVGWRLKAHGYMCGEWNQEWYIPLPVKLSGLAMASSLSTLRATRAYVAAYWVTPWKDRHSTDIWRFWTNECYSSFSWRVFTADVQSWH